MFNLTPVIHGPFRYTDAFGWRGVVPGLGDLGTHTGQDLAADLGTPLYAPAVGVVRSVWWDAFVGGGGAGGNMVSIDHGNGYESRLAHMQHTARVAVGDAVHTATVIGYLGMSGAATGPHVHQELLVNGVYVDPLPYISATATDDDEEMDEDEMQNSGFYYMNGNKQMNVVVNTASGFVDEFESASGSYNSGVARAYNTPTFEKISSGQAAVIKAAAAAVRAGK